MTNKAFLLRPDTPPGGRERPLREGEQPGQLSPPLRAAALDAGLARMRRPTWTPNSLKPLQAMHHAKLQGMDGPVRDAFYRAYWEEGQDIGRVEVIREVTEVGGLEWAPLEQALEESRYLDAVMGEYQEAIDMGFQGIPAFVFGDMKFTGAQPMALFRKLADRAIGMLEQDPDAFARVPRSL